MDQPFRLHHIGVLVADIARTCEQFTSRFGFVVESPIIEDPHQTAFVQFLRLPGADHWTELVSPSGAKSVLRGALDRQRGGIHHVCYEVDAVDAALAHLRAQSMAIVSAPAASTAFGGRRIAWVMDRDRFLLELVESGPGPLSLAELRNAAARGPSA
jgi:methylmalonyl-CoA/ethylmalonyl-CoA epimerase